MKKPYSFSIEEDLVWSIKRYYFINWSKVVDNYLKKHMTKYKTELEELLKTHEVLKRARVEGF